MPDTTRNTLDLMHNLVLIFGIGIGGFWIVFYFGIKLLLWVVPEKEKTIMTDWIKYTRVKQVEAKKYQPSDDLSDVRVPDDYEPKEGDVIVRDYKRDGQKRLIRDEEFQKYYKET